MADLAGLSYFQVDQLVNALVPDTLDVGYDPDLYNVWMSFEIVARVEGAPGLTSLRLTTLDPPRTLILTITDARIETGVLKLPRANAPAGETTPPTSGQIAAQQDSTGLRLLAHSDALGVGDRRLLYDFKPGDCTINGRSYRLPGFTIAAPHVDPGTYDTTNPPKVNLTTASRVVDENPALGTGLIAAVPDRARINGDGKLVFSSAGVDMPDPITLPGGGSSTPADGSVTTVKINAGTLVTASETIAANNNDTTIPTSAAVAAAIAAGGSGGLSLTDDGNGDFTIGSSGNATLSDDGNGDFTIGAAA